MGLKLNGATSGSIELDPQAALGSDRVITLNATGDSTLTLPDANGTLDRLERAGNILQVVQSTFTNKTTTNSSTYVDTGLSVSITPTSASSKILIMTTFLFGQLRNPTLAQDNMKSFTLVRGSTDIAPGNSRFFAHQNQASGSINWAEQSQVCSITYLDSPSTTSATTYKLQMKVDTSATTIYFNTRGNGGGDHPGSSTITVMEVAA